MNLKATRHLASLQHPEKTVRYPLLHDVQTVGGDSVVGAIGQGAYVHQNHRRSNIINLPHPAKVAFKLNRQVRCASGRGRCQQNKRHADQCRCRFLKLFRLRQRRF